MVICCKRKQKDSVGLPIPPAVRPAGLVHSFSARFRTFKLFIYTSVRNKRTKHGGVFLF
jgi:hypothetical protein